MKKAINLDQIAGVVALSYLVLIPAALYVGYKWLREMDEDLRGLAQMDRTRPLRHLTNLFRHD